ncbi:MAG: 50S ribosomal protein L25 [Candidatus Hinthialibacter antarcticus]|nr:50S ribosomal protein L25 [Candidatus Hinthialibacter antarcticus]
MKRMELPVQLRDRVGKGGARSTRRAGMLPAVVYGGSEESMAVSVDRRVLEKSLHGAESENILVNLKFSDSGNETLTLLRDTQHHPLRGSLDHVDFLRISIDKPITLTVPVATLGTAKGVKEGGVFELVQREIDIECLPLDIPDHIEVDISDLAVGDTLHVSDIPENPKYTILTALEDALATVTIPAVMSTETDEEGEEGEEGVEGEEGDAEGEDAKEEASK